MSIWYSNASGHANKVIDTDLKTELTTTSVVKGLLLQVLQLSVGDNALYKALTHAYELSIHGKPSPEVENALWQAFELGLRSDRNHTIVLDGLDRLKGGEGDMLAILERVQKIATKNSKTKCVAFSRPVSKAPSTYAQFFIQNDHTRQDLQFLVESLLASSTAFESLNLKDRTTVTSRVVEQADGSFDYTLQAVEILKTQSTTSILKNLDGIPKGLQQIWEASIAATVDLKQRDTKALLYALPPPPLDFMQKLADF